jgi:hypothetical protein
MSQTIGNPPVPAGSIPRPLGASTVGRAMSAAERAELIRRIEIDRQGLAQMMADRATRARHIAQLDAQIKDLKKHGSQLVKRLQVARQAAGSHERTMLALRERIAVAEQRLMGVISQSLGDRPINSTTVVAAQGVTLVAEPRTPAATKPAGSVVAPMTTKKGPDATSHRNGSPAPGDADDCIMIDEHPLIGRLVEYQSRQMRPERRRRAALAVFLFLSIVAGLAGFSLLVFKMIVDDPLKRDGQHAAQEQSERGAPEQQEQVVAPAADD